ncbi:MAG TPA: YgiQ family radical SAM protein, partial [Planctomycetia bacterium]|nr:YgiQ family radical SAM protein [Planctomycetia bacterium]
LEAGRQDLIGDGCDCLIPARAPAAALEKRRAQANEAAADPDPYHAVGKPPHAARPGRGKQRQSRVAPGRAYRPDAKPNPNSPPKRNPTDS